MAERNFSMDSLKDYLQRLVRGEVSSSGINPGTTNRPATNKALRFEGLGLNTNNVLQPTYRGNVVAPTYAPLDDYTNYTPPVNIASNNNINTAIPDGTDYGYGGGDGEAIKYNNQMNNYLAASIADSNSMDHGVAGSIVSPEAIAHAKANRPVQRTKKKLVIPKAKKKAIPLQRRTQKTSVHNIMDLDKGLAGYQVDW